MTARALFQRCRKAGITLAADGDGISFDASPGVAVPVDDLRKCKAELLALLTAFALLLTISDPEQREALAYRFDERAGICQYDGNMSRGEAERQAYIELAKAVEGVGDESPDRPNIESTAGRRLDLPSGGSVDTPPDDSAAEGNGDGDSGDAFPRAGIGDAPPGENGEVATGDDRWDDPDYLASLEDEAAAMRDEGEP